MTRIITPVHAAPSIVVSLALCAAAMPALAVGDGADEAPIIVGVALRAELVAQLVPVAAPRLGTDGIAASDVIDYRLWLGAGRASVGVGVAAPPVRLATAAWTPADARIASSRVVGVRYHLSHRSRVYVDTASRGADRLLPERDVRMGFEFKSAPSTALGIARGNLFRVHWSSKSQVSLRLRGGGLTIAYRERF